MWNEFIVSMRSEDLISHREKDMLVVPYSSGNVSVVQWPPFLLASKIPIALDMAKDFKKREDADRIKKIKKDVFMYFAIIDCYETLRDLLLALLLDEGDKKIILQIFQEVESSIEQRRFLMEFKMSGLPVLGDKLGKFLDLLVVRLRLLLTLKESAINVPMNLEARRRITFFMNSLFMAMPSTPEVRNMLSFSVLTPYYKETVLYSTEELNKENEDGITTLFYHQKIYPDEWRNYEERINDATFDPANKNPSELDQQWVSFRGHTLARTVRGMMYYREALELQCFLDFADDNVLFGGYRAIDAKHRDRILKKRIQALADLKFTYVVSCQVYGDQKKSSDAHNRSCYVNILNLMLAYTSLRVAYIDDREETINGKTEKVYYSVLVKGGEKLDEGKVSLRTS